MTKTVKVIYPSPSSVIILVFVYSGNTKTSDSLIRGSSYNQKLVKRSSVDSGINMTVEQSSDSLNIIGRQRVIKSSYCRELQKISRYPGVRSLRKLKLY